MPKITIHNAETGEIIEREMNADELEQFEKDVANEKAKIDALKDAAAKKQALLDKLGISAEEAKLLLA